MSTQTPTQPTAPSSSQGKGENDQILHPSVESPALGVTTRSRTGANRKRNRSRYRSQKGKEKEPEPLPFTPGIERPWSVSRSISSQQGPSYIGPRQPSEIDQIRDQMEQLRTSMANRDQQIGTLTTMIEGLIRLQNEHGFARPRTEHLPSVSRIEEDVSPTPFRSNQETPFFGNESSPDARRHKSKITEKIDLLDDGISPTYQQWKISVRDRLLVNADHYNTVATRKALIWGTTTGLAQSYLLPRYQSDSDHLSFKDHQEMIALLESYFLTGYETEDARNAFQALHMGGKDHTYESFAEFRGRFTSMAVLGAIPDSELFYYMWEKITPQLRASAAVQKRSWNHSLSAMTADLLALDKEKRRNAELSLISGRAGVPVVPTIKKVYPILARSKTKPSIPTRVPTATPPPRQFSTQPTALQPERFKTESRPVSSTCFRCGKPGHFATSCPNLPAIKEI